MMTVTSILGVPMSAHAGDSSSGRVELHRREAQAAGITQGLQEDVSILSQVVSSAPMRAFNSKTCCPDWKPILQSGGAVFAAIWLQPGLLTTFAPSTAATFSTLRCFVSIQRTDLVAADRTVMHR